ncbi:methyltransferase domain-containing protein [Cylindrospermopsis raciborskii]|uniref:methyltransferase domain-containing protein n=1 Tax=Cylindrospermopsis raciborskii TaxID=77022 RepID=UPI000B5E1CC8|nr:type II restriction enzyme NspV homolog [Raphidiopsis curvata NIES-932]
MAKSSQKSEFGDFQTPDNLAKCATHLLKDKYGVRPDLIIEPTCGKGAFIRASLTEFKHTKIVGFDINEEHIQYAKTSSLRYPNSENVTLCVQDFFSMNWDAFLADFVGSILVIGNPPWVTTSELTILNSKNLPSKSNFQNRQGIHAITGSSNFDISEWMLLKHVQWLTKKEGTLAVLCKYSVARKIINQVITKFGNRFSADIYLIDAKTLFGASVDACFFVLSNSGNTNCDFKIYQDLQSDQTIYSIGNRDGRMVRDTTKYEKWKHLSGQDLRYTWRSGIKHDCSKIMEFQCVDDGLFINGMGEKYFLEREYLYPLLKGSDIANSRIDSHHKFVLVTQKSVGEDTIIIRDKAPKIWQYLLEHDQFLKTRKSSIYKNKPPYSIFGIGEYSFKNWKIAISGLYKKLNFCLVEPIGNQPVMLDDTVNFLSFDTQREAEFIFSLITSDPSIEFLNSMIFWDEKRPITIDILRRVSLKAVAREIDVLEIYLALGQVVRSNPNGQLELAIV